MSISREIQSIVNLQRMAGLRDDQMAQVMGYASRAGWNTAKHRGNAEITVSRIRPLLAAGANINYILFGILPAILVNMSPEEFRARLLNNKAR